ncbi:MAG: hypothetical protein CME80_17785 [Halomonas sp.]|nr:hypothetical protein [Halomonas sp.]
MRKRLSDKPAKSEEKLRAWFDERWIQDDWLYYLRKTGINRTDIARETGISRTLLHTKLNDLLEKEEAKLSDAGILAVQEKATKKNEISFYETDLRDQEIKRLREALAEMRAENEALRQQIKVDRNAIEALAPLGGRLFPVIASKK